MPILLRKKATSLAADQILTAFTKEFRGRLNSTSIIAEVITKDIFDNPFNPASNEGDYKWDEGEIIDDQKEKVSVRYLTLTDLEKYLIEELQDSPSSRISVLQCFVNPSGKQNNVIQALWSTRSCMLTRCTNVHDVHNENLPASTRGATFDAPELIVLKSGLHGKEIAK